MRRLSLLLIALAMFYGAEGLAELFGEALRPATKQTKHFLRPGSWFLGVLASFALAGSVALCAFDSRRRPARAFGVALVIFALTCAVDCARGPARTLKTVVPRALVLTAFEVGLRSGRQLASLRPAELQNTSAAD